MTARIRTTDSGAAVVEALLSEWQAIGRFLHARLSDGDRVLTLTGLSADEAERLAHRINTTPANPVRRAAIGHRPFSLLENRA